MEAEVCGKENNEITRLANLLKAVGHPIRVQIVSILAKERLASIPTIQRYLAGTDQFVIYSNLSYLHERNILRKLRKGREIYYSLTDTSISEGLDFFSRSKLVQETVE